MYKKTMIASGIAIALAALPVMAEEGESWVDDFEVSGELKNETAVFTKAGTTIGASTAHDNRDVMKSETSARFFINGPVGEGSEVHAEIRPVRDSQAVDGYKGHESYTQQDFLRELYVDTTAGEEEAVSLRLGKQQVVWGTADGMKLLDIINPTDYREMAQNSMDESRIPVWMINVEADLEDGSNLQVVVSQPKENVFAGLNRGVDTSVRSNNLDGSDKVYAGTDEGHAFMMKGPDSITGGVNGFLNIAPDLGSIAAGFGGAFMPLGSAATELGGLGGMVYSGIADNPATTAVNEGYTDGMSDLLSAFTVGGFTSGATLQQLSDNFVDMQMGKAYANLSYSAAPVNTGDDAADAITNRTNFLADYVYPALSVDPDGVSIAGDAMAKQFRDLNFAGAVAGMACADPATGANNPGQLGAGTCVGDGTTTQTDFDLAAAGMTGTQVLNGWAAGYGANLSSFSDGSQDSAFEYMTNTGFRTFDTFVNARSQYKYDMPSNSDLDIAFRVKRSLDSGLNYSLNYSYNYDKNPVINMSWRNDAGEVLTQNTVAATLTMAGPTVVDGTYLKLTDAAGNVYGGATGNSAILTFEQSVERAHNIGTALDYAIDTEGLGAVVLRGEFLYQKDLYQPVMALSNLALGDLVGALQMKKANRFKYVLGADIIVATNMMISAQFIQDRNLDHIDDATGYTTDYATMHLSNGFLKAEENKEFYSLFFSKPFGGEQQHRWNNILMLEENGGRWNRFDVEYSFNDEV
ncbi:MAG: hypothetical protein HOL70_03955, partial [Candidatus Marinimicrobia bacterium]|nr:hypothetical protein [Candidatus Neomarinimicrobiota bacterium]